MATLMREWRLRESDSKCCYDSQRSRERGRSCLFPAMEIRIEFFGIPRHRAGVAEIEVEAATLGAALREVRRRLPQLDQVCAADGRLCGGYLASLNGRNFVSDPSTPLAEGDCLLILSSDTGG